MLKTNSKAAKNNLHKYIMENADFSNYDHYEEAKNAINQYNNGMMNLEIAFPIVASAIYKNFHFEKDGDNRRLSDYELFEEWASGLPSSIDMCFWYNRSAIDDLGAILEETETEKERFTDSEACIMLTKLIYREIRKF